MIPPLRCDGRHSNNSNHIYLLTDADIDLRNLFFLYAHLVQNGLSAIQNTDGQTDRFSDLIGLFVQPFISRLVLDRQIY